MPDFAATRTQDTPSYVPSPTVEDFILSVRNGTPDELRVLILQGSRGEGKTTAGAAAFLSLAERLSKVTPELLPLRIAVIRDSWVNLSRTTVESLRDFGRKGIAIEWRDSGRQAIMGPVDNPLVHYHFFGLDRPADADKLQGFECSAIWLEEVAPAADLSAGIPAESFGLGVTSLRQRGVPKRVVVTMNPPDEDAWILHVEELLDEMDLGSVRVRRWAIPPGEKERHFRYLASLSRTEAEAQGWTQAADEFKAYRDWCDAALTAIGRRDLAGRLVGGEVGEIRVGEPVVSTFVRALHVVDELEPMGSQPIVRGWDGGGCYDSETEVLTETGWRAFAGLTGDERLATRTVDGRLEYHRPSRLIHRPHEGPMYEYHTHNVDFLLTPEHRIPVLREQTGWSETSARQTPEELADLSSTHSAVALRAQWDGESRDQYGPLGWSSATYAAFMGWWLSEGSVSRTTNAITIYQTRRDHDTEIERVLDDTGLSWTPMTAYRKRVGWLTASRALADHLRPLGLQRMRRVPEEVWLLSRADLGVFFDAVVAGDGTTRKPRHGWRGGDRWINTASAQLAGEYQALAMKAGWYARVFARPPERKILRDRGGREHFVNGGPTWRVSIKTRASAGCLNGKRLSVVAYSGMVHCATVPNGTLYVRRHGIAHWNGNSPSCVIGQAVGENGRAGFNILASHTMLNTPLDQFIREWVLPTMSERGIMPVQGPRGAYSSGGAPRRRAWTYRDIGDPSMVWEGGTVKAENTSGRVIQEMLNAALEPGPIDWDSRREALLSAFGRPGHERARFIAIDKRDNALLIQAVAGRFRYPKDLATGRITMTVQAAKRASGPKFSGVPDALAYELAMLYPAAEWVRQTLLRPVPKVRRRSWLAS